MSKKPVIANDIRFGIGNDAVKKLTSSAIKDQVLSAYRGKMKAA